jgi:ATP-dependent RNA helicase DeaD
VLTWNPAALAAFLERQAPRAAQFGQQPLDADGRPASAAGPARYVIATPDRRLSALRQVLDTLDPTTFAVWTPDERHAARLRDVLGLPPEAVVSGVPEHPVRLVICARVPGRDAFTALAQSGPVVLLAAPYQLPYLRSVASPLEPVNQVAAADAARDRGAQLRERIAARLTRADVDAELQQLAPLFERYEPAEVAAALLALRREEPAAPAAPVAKTVTSESWVRLFVTVGKRDKAAAKDLVGAMTRELGVAKEDIGKVDVRDTFTLVEIAARAAPDVIQGLSRVTVRGRRLTARLDRSS